MRRAWDKSWITNNGELVQQLESELKEYLGVKHLFFCTNGTIVLQMALKALDVKKEVITTPFSYVATTNAILWEGCTPVFVDIDRNTFCIDPYKIEASITEKTEAILATHVFGYPCNIDKLEVLSHKYNLKIIYDGAHGFGSNYNGRSLLSYGDVSTCSFHATKLFHTVEGGCVITNNDEVAQKLMLFRQFGHIGDDYYSVGINGKNSEFHAAMGICVLKDINIIISTRRRHFVIYDELLKGLDLKRIIAPKVNFDYNYSYYPVLFRSEELLLQAMAELNEIGVNARRYFFPSLNTLPYLSGSACIISEDISRRVLCLPMFFDLKEHEIEAICNVIKKVSC